MFENSPRYKNLLITIQNFGISNKAEFLGQVAQESAMLTKFTESMNYSVTGILATWSRALVSEEDAWRLGRIDAKVREATGSKRPDQPAKQRELANKVYGGRMGNRLPNDGWDFRGHGGIMITGRDTHAAFSKHVGRPEIMLSPALVAEDPQLSTDCAGWFWCVYKRINGLHDVRRITELVTGSPNHFLEARKALTLQAAKSLG